MKMTKKIFLGAVAVVAFALVGCGFGDAELSGNKWEKNVKLDATEESEVEYTYSRAFKPLSTSKNCSAISTTIVVDKENTIETAGGKNAVVGLAFDTHLSEDGEFYDFVLVGVKPVDGKYYVERYTGVSKEALKEDMKTKDTTIGGTYTEVVPEVGGWAATALTLEPNADGNKEWTITVTQDTPFTYDIAINGNKVGSYEVADDDQVEGKLKSKGKQVGQVFVYGNAPKGTKFDATYTSDKEATVGLFADEE